MRVRLQTRLVGAFVLMGLMVLLVSAGAYYFSFKRLAYERLEAELREDAREFAETLTFADGAVGVRDHHEWDDADDEFVAATDARFQTLRKSENLGGSELQAHYAFRPVSSPKTVLFEMGGVPVCCVVFPVFRNGIVAAYILIATRTEQVTEFAGLLLESMAVALIFLILFGAGAAYVLAGRVVRPMLSIEQAVGAIDLKNLDRRIELVQADSEVQRLVETLNDLFGRLEKSYHEINNFSSNVAHELHTPLTILRGNIDVALTRERTPEAYVEILSELLEETLHIIHIVDSLLLLARGDTASLALDEAPIDLVAFCEEQARDWEAVCSLKGQPLTFQAPAAAAVSGDRNLLSQLLLNLVSNASKYSAEGQPVAVVVQAAKEAFAGHGGVQIAVRDRGVGISEAEQERVFERFYRVKKDRSRETGGAGLGLAICQMIARLHGGTIRLTSLVGSGTEVCVVLPVDRSRAGMLAR